MRKSYGSYLTLDKRRLQQFEIDWLRELTRINAPVADPAPWCHQCGARKESDCKCGPIADNNLGKSQREAS